MLNQPAAIARASNKLDSLRIMRDAGVSVPPFWDAAGAVDRGRERIFLARTHLRSSGGEGIHVVRPGEALPNAPLYVQYIRKSHEYRVHVLGGAAAVVQQKRRRNGVAQTANQELIRNYDNGWIFAVENVEFPSEALAQRVRDQSVAAVRALGLDFGAVDVIISLRNPEVYVLEVNTAPGIESPRVLAAYVEFFRERERNARRT